MTPPQSPTPELVEKFAKMRARAASDASSTSSVASSASFERIVTVPPVNEPTDATEAANRPGNVWLKLTPESDDDVTDATASPTRGPPASALRRNSNVDVQPSVAPPPAIVFPTFPPPTLFGGQPQPAIPRGSNVGRICLCSHGVRTSKSHIDSRYARASRTHA